MMQQTSDATRAVHLGLPKRDKGQGGQLVRQAFSMTAIPVNMLISGVFDLCHLRISCRY